MPDSTDSAVESASTDAEYSLERLCLMLERFKQSYPEGDSTINVDRCREESLFIISKLLKVSIPSEPYDEVTQKQLDDIKNNTDRLTCWIMPLIEWIEISLFVLEDYDLEEDRTIIDSQIALFNCFREAFEHILTAQIKFDSVTTHVATPRCFFFRIVTFYLFAKDTPVHEHFKPHLDSFFKEFEGIMSALPSDHFEYYLDEFSFLECKDAECNCELLKKRKCILKERYFRLFLSRLDFINSNVSTEWFLQPSWVTRNKINKRIGCSDSEGSPFSNIFETIGSWVDLILNHSTEKFPIDKWIIELADIDLMNLMPAQLFLILRKLRERNNPFYNEAITHILTKIENFTLIKDTLSDNLLFLFKKIDDKNLIQEMGWALSNSINPIPEESTWMQHLYTLENDLLHYIRENPFVGLQSKSKYEIFFVIVNEWLGKLNMVITDIPLKVNRLIREKVLNELKKLFKPATTIKASSKAQEKFRENALSCCHQLLLTHMEMINFSLESCPPELTAQLTTEKADLEQEIQSINSKLDTLKSSSSAAASSSRRRWADDTGELSQEEMKKLFADLGIEPDEVPSAEKGKKQKNKPSKNKKQSKASSSASSSAAAAPPPPPVAEEQVASDEESEISTTHTRALEMAYAAQKNAKIKGVINRWVVKSYKIEEAQRKYRTEEEFNKAYEIEEAFERDYRIRKEMVESLDDEGELFFRTSLRALTFYNALIFQLDYKKVRARFFYKPGVTRVRESLDDFIEVTFLTINKVLQLTEKMIAIAEEIQEGGIDKIKKFAALNTILVRSIREIEKIKEQLESQKILFKEDLELTSRYIAETKRAKAERAGAAAATESTSIKISANHHAFHQPPRHNIYRLKESEYFTKSAKEDRLVDRLSTLADTMHAVSNSGDVRMIARR